MAEEEVVVRMSAKDEGIVRAWQAGRNSIAAYNSQLEKLDSSQAKNAKSAAEWDRIAKKTLQDIATPQERHNNKLKELSELLQRGKLNFNQFTTAAEKSQQQLDAVNKSVDDGSSFAGAFAGKIVGVASAIGGVAAIAATLKAEYQDLLERQGKAGDTQISLAAAQRSAVINLGNDETLSPQQMTEELKKLAGETGVKEEKVTQIFSDMLSTRAERKARDVLPSLRTVLKTAPDQADLPTLGAATMSLQNTFKTTGDEAMGFMLQTQAASPVRSMQSLAMNSVPSIISVSKFGDSAEQAAELVAGMASAGADTRGAESGTASIQLAARLEKILPKLKSTAERIEAVRKSKGLQKKVFAEEFGEAQYKPIFRELLTGGEDTPTLRAYRGAQQAITSPENGAPVLNNLLDKYNKLPLAQTAAASRTFESGADQLRSGDIFGGQSAVARKGLEEMLSAANVPKTFRDLTMLDFDAATQAGNSAPIGAAASRLRKNAQAKLNPQTYVPGLVYGEGGGDGYYVSRNPTDEETRVGKGMDAVANALFDLQAAIEKNTKATNDNSQAAKKPASPVMLNTSPPGKPASAENGVGFRGTRQGAAP